MTRAWGRGLAAVVAACLAAGAAAAKCSLNLIGLLPVTMTDSRPLTSARINGAEVTFEIDSGAFFSMLSPSKAAELHLRLEPMPVGFLTVGVGGSVAPRLAVVDHFGLSGADLRHIDFLVGGSEVGEDTVGLLGENFLSLRDAEYDLGHGMVRLFEPKGCGWSTAMAYWSHDGDYSVAALKVETNRLHAPVAEIVVNGVKINAAFDTGAGSSVISLAAAKRAGIDIRSPEVTPVGLIGGIGRRRVAAWIAPIDSIEIGGETIRHTKIQVADLGLDYADFDMLIGADFFLSHHVYVANSQNRIYFTYGGGRVFDLASAQTARPEATPPEAAAPAVAAKGPPAAPPEDAETLGRRGAAAASRRDFAAAIADLTRAVEAAPTDSRWLRARAEAYMESGQTKPAAEDLDQALKLAPDDTPLRLDRARLRMALKDTTGAVADLDAIDRLAARPAHVRLDLMQLYLKAGMPAAALAQSELWLAAHPEDNRYGLALLGRALSRVLLNQDIAKALADCDAAARRQADPAKLAEVRALAHVRRGEWDAALADYARALAIRPKEGELLYGRGQTKRRKGLAKEGDADIAAALAADPDAARLWERYRFGA